MLRRSPRFRKGNSSDSKAKNPSIVPGHKVSGSIVNVPDDFRPLLWQNSLPELSESEIRFPTPQPAPSTALFDGGPKSACSHESHHAAASLGSFRAAAFANWKAALKRLHIFTFDCLILIVPLPRCQRVRCSHTCSFSVLAYSPPNNSPARHRVGACPGVVW